MTWFDDSAVTLLELTEARSDIMVVAATVTGQVGREPTAGEILHVAPAKTLV